MTDSYTSWPEHMKLAHEVHNHSAHPVSFAFKMFVIVGSLLTNVAAVALVWILLKFLP